MAGICHICNRPVARRYVNEAVGEFCAHPCHWPYLSSPDVARASIALDRVPWLNAEELRVAWQARETWVQGEV